LLNSSQAFIKELESAVITTDSLIKYNSAYGKNRATWVHPQVAINIAQWISPQFNVQVSKWIFELTTTGSVTLGHELTNKQLSEEYKKTIGIDIREFKDSDVFYIVSFVIEEEQGEIRGDNRTYYKFGVSSNFSNRLNQHENDKVFSEVITKNVFKCKSGSEALEVEKYVKRILTHMKLQKVIEKKKECFVATPDEYKVIVDKIQEFLESNKEKHKPSKSIEFYKIDKESQARVQIQIQREREIMQMFKDKFIDFKQMKELIIQS
jgi:predicted GIY-YIG superfamily endonuclease